MTQAMLPFLTFQGGVGHAALELYRTVFDDFEVLELTEWGEGGPGPAGTIMSARVRLAGGELRCSDSPIDHAWGFTPAVSLWVDLDSAEALDRACEALLADGGQTYMPAGDYGFSRRFAWVGDRFGVTWQLNLS